MPPSRRLTPARAWTLCAISAALLGLNAGPAWASEPKDRVICTEAPQSTWMSEAEARKRFQANKYLLVRFKISGEKCHEFYALEHDGTAIEAYVHPVTGEVVRMTRIPPPGKGELTEMRPEPPAGAAAKAP